MGIEKVMVNGREFISVDKAIDMLVDATLMYVDTDVLEQYDDERNAIEFVTRLLGGDGTEAFKAYKSMYIHKRFEDVFRDDKEL